MMKHLLSAVFTISLLLVPAMSRADCDTITMNTAIIAWNEFTTYANHGKQFSAKIAYNTFANDMNTLADEHTPDSCRATISTTPSFGELKKAQKRAEKLGWHDTTP